MATITAKVGPKYQLVIPKQLRAATNLKIGDFLKAELRGDRILLTPMDVVERADHRVALLLENLRHPSLRAKKYDEARDIWQARVDAGWRFYFRIAGDAYVLDTIRPHPK